MLANLENYLFELDSQAGTSRVPEGKPKRILLVIYRNCTGFGSGVLPGFAGLLGVLPVFVFPVVAVCFLLFFGVGWAGLAGLGWAIVTKPQTLNPRP